MKKIIKLLALTVGVFMVGCTSDFEQINTTPNNALETDPNLLIAASIQNLQNTMYNMQIGGDMGMCWAQHQSKVQYNDEEKYIPRRGQMNALWDVTYATVIKELKEANKLAVKEGNTNLQAVSLVLEANAFQILTDVFGPVVYSDFGATFPKYDSQEEVYDGILAKLDEAETLFSTGTGAFKSSADLIYKGDVSKWRKLAASLKFKALMRISKVRNVSTQLQALYDSGLLMSSNSDSAQLVYTAAQPDANPINETVVGSNRNEYKVSSVLVDALKLLNDPRLAVFAQKNNAGQYVGNMPGVENPSNYNGFSALGTKYLDPKLPAVFLSYAQVQFFVAEAINEGYVTGGLATARTHFFNGIDANFDYNGLAASSTYKSNPSVDFGSQADARVKIATQMWYALYGQGIEAWTEWRRTGYPVLSPAAGAAINSIPKRFYYSTDESTLNRTNYNAAIATLDNGDSMLSKLWWMN